MLQRTLALFCLLLPLSIASCGDDGDGAACYSPTQGLASPYDNHHLAMGCACDPAKDQGICVTTKGPAYGLMCFQGHWQSVIDGPCLPPSPLIDAGADTAPAQDAAADTSSSASDAGVDSADTSDLTTSAG
jgi:hypothetical protein